jgi:hypothetical protein
VAASTVCSFYSAVSRYTDAAEDAAGGDDGFDGAQSVEKARPRARMPKAPASVRRFLNFDKEAAATPIKEGEEAVADEEDGSVVPATPSAAAVAGAADPAPASPAASSITGPPSPGRGAAPAAASAQQQPAGSAVPSHPLNVDEDEEDGEEAATAAPPLPPPPALIPARAATAGSDALPPLHAASSVDLGLGDAKTAPKVPSPVLRESAKSTAGVQPGLWSRVFGKGGGGGATTTAPAAAPAAAASKPAAFEAAAATLPSPAASATGPVTHLTASGPAGAAGAVEAPARKGLFGW